MKFPTMIAITLLLGTSMALANSDVNCSNNNSLGLEKCDFPLGKTFAPPLSKIKISQDQIQAAKKRALKTQNSASK